MAITVPCPTCQRPVPWTPESRFRPFCSERCRLIDLGEWLSEGHVIPEPLDGAPLVDDDPDQASDPTPH